MTISFSLIVFLVNPVLNMNKEFGIQVKHIDDKQDDEEQKDEG